MYTKALKNQGNEMSVKWSNLSIIAILTVAILSSCALTTDMTESGSGSFENTIEAFSDLTTSSTPDDDEEAKNAQVLKFVKFNYSRVRSDMAVGKGEYLTTLAILLAVEDNKKEQFYTLMKNNFNRLFVSSETSAEEFVSRLNSEMVKVHI